MVVSTGGTFTEKLGQIPMTIEWDLTGFLNGACTSADFPTATGLWYI